MWGASLVPCAGGGVRGDAGAGWSAVGGGEQEEDKKCPQKSKKGFI